MVSHALTSLKLGFRIHSACPWVLTLLTKLLSFDGLWCDLQNIVSSDKGKYMETYSSAPTYPASAKGFSASDIQGSLLAYRCSGIGAGLWRSVDTGFRVRNTWLRSWFCQFMMSVFFSKGFLWISTPCLDLGGWMSAGLLCRRSSVMIRMVPGQRTENTFAFLLGSIHMALWVQQPLLTGGWASWGTRSPAAA